MLKMIPPRMLHCDNMPLENKGYRNTQFHIASLNIIIKKNLINISKWSYSFLTISTNEANEGVVFFLHNEINEDEMS